MIKQYMLQSNKQLCLMRETGKALSNILGGLTIFIPLLLYFFTDLPSVFLLIIFCISVLFFLYSLLTRKQKGYYWKLQENVSCLWNFRPEELEITLSFTKNLAKPVQDFRLMCCTSDKNNATQIFAFRYTDIKKVYWCEEEGCFVLCYNETGRFKETKEPVIPYKLFLNSPYSFFCTQEERRDLSELFYSVMGIAPTPASYSQILLDIADSKK